MNEAVDNAAAAPTVPAHRPFDRDAVLASFAYGALIASVVFQLTVLPETLGIKPVARIVNAGLLASFALLFVFNTLPRRVPAAVMYFYLAPVLLLLLGFGINLAVSFSPANLGYASILLPVLAAASVPFLRKFDLGRAWQIYYWLMLVLCLVSLVEYVLVFSGRLPLSVHENDRGTFVRGILTMFFNYGGPMPHYRLYGVFFEPGTAAMLVTPALTFALIHRRLIGIPVFLAIFVLTNSLGGYMALAVTLALFIYVSLGRLPYPNVTRLMLGTAMLPVAIALAIYFFAPEYDQKSASASLREYNILAFFANFLGSLAERPFGFPFSGNSLTALSRNADYFGSNFMIYVAFVQGGILAMLGYLILLGTAVATTLRVVLAPRGMSPAVLCAFVSLPAMLLFSFQRHSAFETILLGFLYAVPIMGVLGGPTLWPLPAAGTARPVLAEAQ